MPTLFTTSSDPHGPAHSATLSQFALLFATNLPCGAVLGLLSAILSRLFTLPFLYALLTGIGIGFVAAHAVHLARVRDDRVRVVGGAVLLGAIAAFVAGHAFDYHHFLRNRGPIPTDLRAIARLTSDRRVTEATRPLSPEERDNLDLMYKAARVDSLWDFMDLRARRGVEFKKTRSNASGFNLGYAGSWAYWSAEVLLMAGLAVAIAGRTPYLPDHADPDH